MRSVALLLCVAVLSVAVTYAAVDAKSKPFLVLHKEVSEDAVVVGGELTVTVSVTNFGQSPAFDVQIVDISPTGGEQTKAVERLDFNQTESVRYTVRATSIGVLKIGTAEASYLAQQGDESRLKATSNLVREEQRDETGNSRVKGTVDVVSASQYDRLHTRYIRETIGYLVLASVPVLFPFFIYTTKSAEVDLLLRESKRKA